MHVHSERSRARQPEGGDPPGSLASRPLRRSDSRRRDPICPSCKVEAFIISARARQVSPSEGPTPAHAHAPQAVGDHAHAPTHTQAVGEEIEGWRLCGRDGQDEAELMVDGRSQGQCGPGPR